MGALITTEDSIGLRILGKGGRSAADSYEQIASSLRRRFGPAHAALFAEPVPRGGKIDWYADLDSSAAPIRLTEAAPAQAERGRAALAQLVGDVTAFAASLQQANDEGGRVLGETLLSALEVPDENMIWLVDAQPVLIFWGYSKSYARPAENPVLTAIRGKALEPSSEPPLEPPAAPPPRPQRQSRPPPGGGASRPVLNDAPSAAEAPRPRRGASISALVWLAVGAFLIFDAYLLSRNCAINLPFLTRPWLNYCPAGEDAGSAAIAAESQRQASLQAEYAQIARETDLERHACLLAANQKPPMVAKTPPPEKDAEMIIPHDTKRLDFLKGCWRSDAGIIEVATSKPLTITYCFEADGNGSRLIRFNDSDVTCNGPLGARRDGAGLVIESGQASCSNGTHFEPARDSCRQGDNGEARCDEFSEGKTEPRFKNQRFITTRD